jgi:dienelactone hydrolase
MTGATTALEYRVDGAVFRGQLAVPEGPGRRPGIVIFPEAPGVGAHVIRRALALASLNYVALAADLHGDGTLFDEPGRMRAAMAELKGDPQRLLRRLQAGLSALVDVPQVDKSRIAAIGYCFGGWCALELARSGAMLQGVGVFHGSLTTAQQGSASRIRARVLVCSGSRDPFVPVDQIVAFDEEMTPAGVDWQVSLYGGIQHGFTSPEAGAVRAPGFEYSPLADARAWSELRRFLGEIFQPTDTVSAPAASE